MNYTAGKRVFSTCTQGRGVGGEQYETFSKRQRAFRLLDVVAQKFPTIKQSIAYYYTSTPLTYRDYIGSAMGAIYGYKKKR